MRRVEAEPVTGSGTGQRNASISALLLLPALLWSAISTPCALCSLAVASRVAKEAAAADRRSLAHCGGDARAGYFRS